MELFPKPRFSQRLVALKDGARKRIQGASLSIRFAKGMLSTLEDYVYISRVRRKEPYPLLKLQLQLLLDLILWEDVVSKYKKQRDEVLAKIQASPTDASLKQVADALEAEILIHQDLVRALRDIGDGIAWRLLDYDRSLLYAIADRPGKKHIDLVGLQAEAIEFERKFDSLDSITLLNDVTHCLKLGDLTTRNADDTFEITEVKSEGKKGGRITRQRQAMRETVEFFNTGHKSEGDVRYEIRNLDLTPKTYFNELRLLIDEAGDKGAAWATFGDHLTVSCLDLTRVAQHGQEKTTAIMDEGHAKGTGPEKAGDLVLLLQSTQKYGFVRNYAPYSIFPLPDLARVKLATGALFMFHYVNVSAVLRLLQSKGWRVTKTPQEYYKEAGEDGDPVAVATVDKGGMSSQIPWPWIGSLAMEFLQPDTLLEMLESIYKEGPSGPVLRLTNLKGEATTWD